MLLSSRMASIPCSPRHSISNIKDVPNLFPNHLVSVASPPATPSLQYFNMRVTQRLHRYRTLKRQWYEVAAAVQNDSSFTSKSVSPLPIPDILPIIQDQPIGRKVNDSPSVKDNSTKTPIQLDPLHSRIQRDLLKLRKLIKARQKKLVEPVSSKSNSTTKSYAEPASINSAYEDQDNNNNTINFRKLSSLNRNKTLDRVKISGCQMRPSTFPQTNSPDNITIAKSNSSSTCSQYSKPRQKFQQQNNAKTFNIYRSRVNRSLPSESLIQGVPPPKKIPNTPQKTTLNMSLRPTQPSRLPISPVIKKKQPTFIKQETKLLLTRQPSEAAPVATCLYTYAASTSSATPRSMKLNRNTSLLPILLTSSSCIGIRSQKSEENDNDLHDYEQLLNDLPKPIIPTPPEYGQDDYRILLEQLDHIRETMPDCNVYDQYTRVY